MCTLPRIKKLLNLLVERDPRFQPLIGIVDRLLFAAIHGGVISRPQSMRILDLPEPELAALSSVELFEEIDGLIGAELSLSSTLPQDAGMSLRAFREKFRKLEPAESID